MKLCTDCRHYKQGNCTHPNNMEKSPVDGFIASKHTAAYLRDKHSPAFTKCEPDGLWHEDTEMQVAA